MEFGAAALALVVGGVLLLFRVETAAAMREGQRVVQRVADRRQAAWPRTNRGRLLFITALGVLIEVVGLLALSQAIYRVS